MSLGLFAPLFAAGAALVALPFIIHQIRRPERIPVRFSSLMFVPKEQKEVVQRRRVEHILLMLMRMACLVLLALAFARPYWSALAMSEGETSDAGRHVVLVDTSYSMGAMNHFEQAKEKAREAIGRLGANDRGAVVAFDASPRVMAPLEIEGDGQAGGKEAARNAVDAFEIGYGPTNYLAALQLAENILLQDQDLTADQKPRMVIHFVSDFQEQGMPSGETDWKVSPFIAFEAYPVGEGEVVNYALSDATVRKGKDDSVQVRAMVKNWSVSNEARVEVKLFVGDEHVESQVIDVAPGNASQAYFSVDWPGNEPMTGRLEMGTDALSTDNVRYFAYTPRRKSLVLVLASDGGTGAAVQPADFISLALPAQKDVPWIAETTTAANLETSLEELEPEVLLIAGAGGIDADTADRVVGFIEDGGSALITLDTGVDYDVAPLFDALGVSVERARREYPTESVFYLFSAIDLDHPIFIPFRGPRFNDFTSVRFYNHFVTRLADDRQANVLARFEGDNEESPAVIDLRYGEGRAIVWAFPLDLSWTNFPKNPRFVPVLYETLSFLGRGDEEAPSYIVGETVAPPLIAADEASWELQLPDGETLEWDGDETALPRIDDPGYVRWRMAEDEVWRQADAVNLMSDESDPTVIPATEFEIKLFSAPVVARSENDGDTIADGREETVVDREFGLWFLVALFGLILAESWYASRLA